MLHWLRRLIRLLAYTLSGLGTLLLILWAIRGARPALACGLLDALRRTDWPAAYFCLDQADFDPLIGGVTLASGALLGLVAWLSREQHNQFTTEVAKLHKRNRPEMLRRVREIWIDNELKHSLYQNILIELPMQQRRGIAPWGMGARIDTSAEHPVPSGKGIIDLFNEAHASLVILGAPGSGKSTVLLQLLQALLDCCEVDPVAPIPVLLNLSTQQREYVSLEAWVTDELVRFYGVPERVAGVWLQEGELALLLDGLDEVSTANDGKVVKQINDFLHRNMNVPLAVCCREVEYTALAQSVEVSGIVRLLPLKDEQIYGYLKQLQGDSTQQLASLLKKDSALRDLAESPLLLNVMLKSVCELRPSLGVSDARVRVYDAYLRTMLKRDRTHGLAWREDKDLYGKQFPIRTTSTYANCDTIHWLQWMAGKMTSQNRTVVLLERINKEWFNRRYEWLIWPLGNGIIFGLIFGSIFGLVFGPLLWQLSGLCVGQVYGIVGGLLCGFFIAVGFGAKDVNIREAAHIKVSYDRLIFGLTWGLILGLVGGLVIGVIVGLILGLTAGLIVGVVLGVAAGLVVGIIFGLLSPSTDLERNYQAQTPNAATVQSLYIGLVVGLIVGLTVGLTGGLVVGHITVPITGIVIGPAIGLTFGLATGLVSGFICALAYGLDNFLKHYLLRLVLWADGSLPLHLVHFLDYCVERALLRRVGGGYMFIHRTFQEYMATVDVNRLEL